jgi:hypothetical protein
MFGKKETLFKGIAKAAAKGVTEAKDKPQKQPKQPKEITIREADNGFIVINRSMYGITSPGEDMPKDKVYSDVDGLHKCIDEVFGKGEKAKDKSEGE